METHIFCLYEVNPEDVLLCLAGNEKTEAKLPDCTYQQWLQEVHHDIDR